MDINELYEYIVVDDVLTCVTYIGPRVPLDLSIATKYHFICPDGIKKIGADAFNSAREHIAWVTLADSVVEIEDKAFYRCQNLLMISGGNVTRVGNQAFEGCINLRSVSFLRPGNYLRFIGCQAFRDCSFLRGIDLSIVEFIGPYAFAGSERLVRVSLSADVIIGYNAFYGCDLLVDEGAFSHMSDSIRMDITNIFSMDFDDLTKGNEEFVARYVKYMEQRI